jgi:hypothetical protein
LSQSIFILVLNPQPLSSLSSPPPLFLHTSDHVSMWSVPRSSPRVEKDAPVLHPAFPCLILPSFSPHPTEGGEDLTSFKLVYVVDHGVFAICRCSGCKSVNYCNEACQQQAWGGHQESCRRARGEVRRAQATARKAKQKQVDREYIDSLTPEEFK